MAVAAAAADEAEPVRVKRGAAEEVAAERALSLELAGAPAEEAAVFPAGRLIALAAAAAPLAAGRAACGGGRVVLMDSSAQRKSSSKSATEAQNERGSAADDERDGKPTT